jgi:hypothetical protein
MEKENTIKLFCEKVVHVSNLPLAQYLSDGQWAVSTVEELRFSQVCPHDIGKVTTTRTVQPPVSVLRLLMSCRAVNGQLTLLPYFKKESTAKFPESPLNFTFIHALDTRKIWEKFHRTFPNFTFKLFPHKLKKIKHIEMDDLENQLKYMYFPTTDKGYYLPNWLYFLLGAIGISLIVVGLICFKCRQRIKGIILLFTSRRE